MPVIVTLYFRISIEADVPGPTTSLRQRHVQRHLDHVEVMHVVRVQNRRDGDLSCRKMVPWGWFMNLYEFMALPSGYDYVRIAIEAMAHRNSCFMLIYPLIAWRIFPVRYVKNYQALPWFTT